MTDLEQAAKAVLEKIIAETGMQFHPEVEVKTYQRTENGGTVDTSLNAALEIMGADIPNKMTEFLVFEPEDARQLQAGLNLAWELWGDDIYEVIKTIEPWKTFFEQQED